MSPASSEAVDLSSPLRFAIRPTALRVRTTAGYIAARTMAAGGDGPGDNP